MEIKLGHINISGSTNCLLFHRTILHTPYYKQMKHLPLVNQTTEQITVQSWERAF